MQHMPSGGAAASWQQRREEGGALAAKGEKAASGGAASSSISWQHGCMPRACLPPRLAPLAAHQSAYQPRIAPHNAHCAAGLYIKTLAYSNNITRAHRSINIRMVTRTLNKHGSGLPPQRSNVA